MDNNIIIVTYSCNQDLRSLSGEFLKKLPFERKVFSEWSGQEYVKNLLYLNADWVVYVDEDAFIYRPASVIDLLEHMKRAGYVCCGVPDGGVIPHRQHNPVACNPFFLILNLAKLRDVLAIDINVSAEWREEYKSYVPDFVMKSENGFVFDDFEPYYSFFFWLCKHSQRILYLQARQWILEPEGISTILLDHNGKPFCLHTWYARQYYINNKPANTSLGKALNRFFNIRRGPHYHRIQKAVKWATKQSHLLLSERNNDYEPFIY